MSRLETQFSKVTTPETPYTGVMGFVVSVDADVEWIGGESMPLVGSTYSASPIQPKVQEGEYGAYVLTSVVGGGGRVMFYYHKHKTASEAAVPFRSFWWKTGDHPWPAVLYELSLVKDRTFGRSAQAVSPGTGSTGVVTAPNYYIRSAYLPATSEGSRFRVQEYFSPVPVRLPHYRTPQAGSVELDVVGLQAGFPECLHDDIEIPATQTAMAMSIGGLTSSVGGSISGQRFPATGFTRRRRYVLMHEQTEVQGGWHGRRVWVYPPRTGELTVR